MVNQVRRGHLYYFPTYVDGAICAAWGSTGVNRDTALLVIWAARPEFMGEQWVLDEDMARQGIEIEMDVDSLIEQAEQLV